MCNPQILPRAETDYGFYAVYLTELILRLGVYGVFVLKSHWHLVGVWRFRGLYIIIGGFSDVESDSPWLRKARRAALAPPQDPGVTGLAPTSADMNSAQRILRNS